MDKRIIGLTIALMAVMAYAPMAMADKEAEGTATITNSDPTVTSVAITDMNNEAADPLAVWTYYKVKVTVEDANSLNDIDEVIVKMYLTARGEGAEDAERDHYTFKYDATTPTWSEIGPDNTSLYDHIDVDGCTAPSPLTSASGTYVFQVRLAYIAEPTTGSLWTAYGKATDSDIASDTNTTTFDVSKYIELGIDTPTLTFSGAPGATNVAPTGDKTIATVGSNTNFDIKVKLLGDWAGTTYPSESIPAGNTKAAMDQTHGNDTILSTTYALLWNNVGYGDGVTKDCFWFLDIPNPCRDQNYTNTLFIQAVEHTG